MNTIYISSRKGKGMELNGNLLTGDTYPMKDYIKAYLGGKWDRDARAWVVDVAKVMTLLNRPGAAIRRTTAPANSSSKINTTTICPKCHTYCQGDCTSH